MDLAHSFGQGNQQQINGHVSTMQTNMNQNGARKSQANTIANGLNKQNQKITEEKD